MGINPRKSKGRSQRSQQPSLGQQVREPWYCKHPYVALTLVWDDVYHCWDCGLLIGEDDDIEDD
jgi:hypothetical protein